MTSRPYTIALGIALTALALAGCSSLQEDKIDYKGAKKGTSLEVPPDLTQVARDTRYNVPGAATGTVSATGYQAAQGATPAASTAAATVGDVRIERAGSKRWLVVNRSAEQLWPLVRDFWKDSGFELPLDQAELGIMETDWAENRAKLPQDGIRRLVGKVFDALYDTGERDKFRTRLERVSATSSEIYISHRGMVEVYTNERKDQTAWQPRPSDPELEAEFLRRLMVKLGAPQEQARAAASNPAATKPSARVVTQGSQSVVLIDESFERAWRRVGLALDRTGFTVEDRDRAKGTYFVRYVDPVMAKKEPGLFGRMFGSSGKEAEPQRYRINLNASAGASTSTTVAVLDNTGKPESSANAQRILKVIADDLQ